MSYDEISGATAEGEKSEAIRARVNAARSFANKRLSSQGDNEGMLNAKLPPEMIRRHCKLTKEASELMKTAFDALGFSARGHDRVLRVARTIADLDASELINEEHIAEAIQYRSLDRKYWKR